MSEIAELSEYWSAFPELREALFTKSTDSYVELAVGDIEQTVYAHPAVKAFISNFMKAFGDFDSFLKAS